MQLTLPINVGLALVEAAGTIASLLSSDTPELIRSNKISRQTIVLLFFLSHFSLGILILFLLPHSTTLKSLIGVLFLSLIIYRQWRQKGDLNRLELSTLDPQSAVIALLKYKLKNSYIFPLVVLLLAGNTSGDPSLPLLVYTTTMSLPLILSSTLTQDSMTKRSHQLKTLTKYSRFLELVLCLWLILADLV